LFIDSKAEKSIRTATIQMSQTSLRVRQFRKGLAVDEQGILPKVSTHGGKEYLTTTGIIHFYYEDIENIHHLKQATIACIPNGKLQDLYNPTATDTIWLVGRNAPTLEEDFRVRLGFNLLKDKKSWRVQHIYYNEDANTCIGTWDD